MKNKKINIYAAEKENTKRIFEYSKMDIEKLFEVLNTDINGLSVDEAEKE